MTYYVNRSDSKAPRVSGDYYSDGRASVYHKITRLALAKSTRIPSHTSHVQYSCKMRFLVQASEVVIKYLVKPENFL